MSDQYTKRAEISSAILDYASDRTDEHWRTVMHLIDRLIAASSPAREVSTGELASAFVAAHDAALSPKMLGYERAVKKGKALDAGVEAVRAALGKGPAE